VSLKRGLDVQTAASWGSAVIATRWLRASPATMRLMVGGLTCSRRRARPVSWAAKNQDGERGKTRRAFARSGVLFAHGAAGGCAECSDRRRRKYQALRPVFGLDFHS